MSEGVFHWQICKLSSDTRTNSVSQVPKADPGLERLEAYPPWEDTYFQCKIITVKVLQGPSEGFTNPILWN